MFQDMLALIFMGARKQGLVGSFTLFSKSDSEPGTSELFCAQPAGVWSESGVGIL